MVGQIDSLLMKCSTSTANTTAIMQSKLHQYQQKDKEKENESRGLVYHRRKKNETSIFIFLDFNRKFEQTIG